MEEEAEALVQKDEWDDLQLPFPVATLEDLRQSAEVKPGQDQSRFCYLADSNYQPALQSACCPRRAREAMERPHLREWWALGNTAMGNQE